MPAPVGAVIVIVPVGVVHVGCVVTLAVGCAGDDGAAFTTSPVSAAELPQLLLAVTEYVPGATDVKLPVLLLDTVTEELLIKL